MTQQDWAFRIIQIGDDTYFVQFISGQNVDRLTRLSGSHNPLHIDHRLRHSLTPWMTTA